jgi:hypothetical protein
MEHEKWGKKLRDSKKTTDRLQKEIEEKGEEG